MKILFPIGSYYPSQQGGPCNSVHALAKGLIKAGHEVRVITTNFDVTPDAGIPFDRWTTVEGVEVHYIKMPETKRPFLLDALFLARPPLLTNILKETPCDLMHTNMLFTTLSHLSAEHAKDKNIPLVWSTHGSMMPTAFARGNLKKRLFLSSSWVRRGLIGCHYHATSEEEKISIHEFFRKYTGEDVASRTHFLPIIMPDNTFISGGDVSPYLFKYILYLGRIHPIKKIEYLIEGFGAARAPQETCLVLAGWTGEDPYYTKMLKGLVEKLNLGDRVVFTEERVEGRDKATLYRHAEVFVLPSESENFGMVVLESLAQGVPVIASNKTPWQILEKKGAGFWPPNDPASLAQALEKIFSLNGDERKKLSANASALAREYNNEALIGKYLKMYEEVVRK